MRIQLVGGTFDEHGGKPSKIIATMMKALGAEGVNGGPLSQLHDFDIESAGPALIWMPNVDNKEDKLLPGIKDRNPHLLLVSSKRVVERWDSVKEEVQVNYTSSDIVGRLLKTRSALGIVVTLVDSWQSFHFRLLDPLGNEWCRSWNVEGLCKALRERLEFLHSMTRVGSRQLGPEFPQRSPPHVSQDFLAIVREFGTRFSTFVNAVNPNRLLGNAATRCSYGFPAVRAPEPLSAADVWQKPDCTCEVYRDQDDAIVDITPDLHCPVHPPRILVTRRNVDKATLSESDFVEVFLRPRGKTGREVAYFGEAKPSVDSPIQILLFSLYPETRYMIHGHVYVKDAPTTAHKVPCGGIEEVDEIRALYPNYGHQGEYEGRTDFAVNLRGHGCLILASTLTFLRSVQERLVARPFPED